MLNSFVFLSSVMQHSSHSYLRLADAIRRDIEVGRYPTDTRLPSVRQLAQTHQVSVATATRCYRHLEQLGWVSARLKSGMYVADWQSPTRRVLPPPSATAAPVVAYDKLLSMQHRMTELYALTAQPLKLGLHLANAAPQWYPCEALSRIGQRLLRTHALALGQYPTGTGWPAFKTQLCGWLAHAGVDAQPDDVLITNGSTEALNMALRAVAQPGETVLVESPVYFGLLQMIENLGLKAVEVPCVPETGISLEALAYALEHQAHARAVVVMPSFQNPLGSTMPEAHKRRLLRLAQTHDIAVIEDDAFGDLSGDGERPQALKAWDKDGRVIYTGSCSKSLAPAFRVGWVLGGRHQAQIQSLKLASSMVTPVFEQAVLAEFIQTGGWPVHVRQLHERLLSHARLAQQAVQQHFPAGTRVVSPAVGLWLWIELPEPMDTLALLRLSVKQGLAFTPGTLFSATGKYSNCLRLNTSQPWGPEMAQGIENLGQLLHQPHVFMASNSL